MHELKQLVRRASLRSRKRRNRRPHRLVGLGSFGATNKCDALFVCFTVGPLLGRPPALLGHVDFTLDGFFFSSETSSLARAQGLDVIVILVLAPENPQVS